MARWKVVSKKIEWPEIFGKECCVPKVKRRIDAEMDDSTDTGQVAEAFMAFSIANGMDGRVEREDGTLFVDIEDAERKGLQYLASCTPKPVWWAVSSALAEGRSATLECRCENEDKVSC